MANKGDIMTIRFRLILSLVAIAIAVFGLAAGGEYALRSASAALTTIYADRIVPMKQLKAVSDGYAVSVVDMSHKARSGAETNANAIKAINDSRSIITKNWRDYTATQLVPKEAQLVAKVLPLIQAADRGIDRLVAILQAGDRAALDAFVTKELYPLIDPVTSVVSDLVDLQLAVAEEENAKAAADKRVFDIVMLSLIIFACFVLVLSVWIVISKVANPLTAMRDAMAKLAQGDHHTIIPAAEQRDEIGAMAKAVQVFKDNMIAKEQADAEIERQRAEAERQRAEREAREKAAGQEIATLCDQVVEGDLSGRIEEGGKDGFYLAVSRQLNRLAATLQGMAGELASVMAAMAEGDLTHTVKGDYSGVFGDLKDSANSTAGRLRDFAGRLNLTAQTVRGASSEISTGSQDLAQRTESQAASIEETAASMHEITTTVKQNAENAQAANQLAVAARTTAEKGGSVTQQAVTAMTDIEASARKISDIVGMMDEIAFQTNLLALNASVEAARAGEAGKGFAVVAQEVRSLAQRSASASKDIKSLIQTSNAQVKSGAELVNQTGTSLTEIVTAVKKVSDIVAEIAAASREQATGLDQINTAVGSMDEMTQRNAALVEETTAAAQSLSTQATELAQLVAFFRT
jgi:methyl-accepting chemotaxis protein